MRKAYQNIKGAAAVAWDREDFLVKKEKKKIKGEKGKTYICIIYAYLNNIEKSPHRRTRSKIFVVLLLRQKQLESLVSFGTCRRQFCTSRVVGF